uniref:NADH-ubiquinone oxidoreductase chain 1 n=1 Tax=Dolicheulota formosensis TaxID=1632114 RepID=A0A0H3W553_DOLFO|nr:NADH dehydrogenase subunit 1 [Dolicheulota formosensis]AKJ85738.1 NADH dehydrogenase subunit 1 [Dolicheulota formosensis]
MLMLMKLILTMLCALIGVAFLTLLERKILSYVQNRKGPNKVGLVGLFQPFSDALKLFLKEKIIPNASNKYMFIGFPILGLGLGLYMWGLLPSLNAFSLTIMPLLLFLCISAMNVYVVMGAGWCSNSLYAFLGAMRASAQTISYEISLVFLILFPMLLLPSFSFFEVLVAYPAIGLLFFSPLLWVISALAETNRAPFDFAEGESELVSGFNVEYGGGSFALLFLGEYTIILFMSVLTSACFLSPRYLFLYVFLGFVVAVIFLLVRGVFPRLRYDKLMNLCWKSILPLSISCLFLLYFTFLL